MEAEGLLDDVAHAAAAAGVVRDVVADVKTGSVLAGQIAGLVNNEQTCQEIITEIMQEAESLLKGAAAWVR